MIYVIATIEVEAGKQAAFLKLFHQLVPVVKEEVGCIAYGPTIDVESNIEAQGGVRPNVVTIVEQWECLEDLETHLIAPHMVAFRAGAKELIKSTALQILEPA